MDKIREVLEEFGRNYSDGECSYCPSTLEDCKKCKKMIKTLSVLKQIFLEMVGEDKE